MARMEYAAGRLVAEREDVAGGRVGPGDAMSERDPIGQLAEVAVEALGAAWGAVYLWREGGFETVPAAVHGDSPPRLPDGRALPLGGVVAGSDDAAPLLCLPARHAGRTYGMLVLSPRPAAGFDRHARALAATLAALGGATLALDSDRVHGGRDQTAVLSLVSHELRTPLNALAGYLEMLSDPDLGSLSGAQREALDATRRSVEEVRELVGAMLELSRLDAGRARLELAEFDLQALVEEVAREVRPFVPEGVQLVCDCAKELGPVRSDRLKLKIILKNLVGNALKFTDRGQVSVRASCEGTTLLLAVADSGVGIAPDELPFIFDRFRQGDRSTARSQDGVGLGLHIVQRLVELFGGAVVVESEQGVGTTFELRLPRTVVAVDAGS